jgi:hypothetical protein
MSSRKVSYFFRNEILAAIDFSLDPNEARHELSGLGRDGRHLRDERQSINRAAMVKSTIHAIISDAMAKSMIRVVLNKIKRIDTSLIMLKIN